MISVNNMSNFRNRNSKFKGKKKLDCNKNARLIIRNLPFCATEEELKRYFGAFGTIKEINILKRPDGRLVGCGFLQFIRKQSAAKAIHHVSGKLFMGRTIIVDWAIPKSKFVESNEKEIKKESFNEPERDDMTTKFIKTEDFNESVEESIKIEKYDSDNSENSNHVHYDSTKKITEDKFEKLRTLTPSCDIQEGKTVFLKNVPFNITNDELKEFMEKIGPVFYAVICMDPLTEHSRGTAFVKFKHKIHADQCLAFELELKLKGTLMQALPALEKKKILNKVREKHPDKKKDNRNLYLVKEGVVIPGTSAAIEVSMSDMKKRLELEMWKSNMLKDLNMFVSRTRLIIHNLPLSYDDKMLKLLFKKHAPPKSRITEAKVMKNLHVLDMEGKPVSKGYGFVSFTEHESALAVLRKINNNPKIFNKEKRPIVGFSIENRAVIHIKQKRLAKSKLNNVLCPDSKKPMKNTETNQKIKTKLKNRTRSENVSSFGGMEAHPGPTKLISKHKVLSHGQIHFHNLKESKKDAKKKRQILEIRQERKKEPKVKSKKQITHFHENQFNELVQKYKQQIVPSNISLKKWYERD